MAKSFEISIDATAVKVEALDRNQVRIELTFASQSDFQREVQDHVDQTDFMQFIGEKDAKRLMNEVFECKSLDEVSGEIEEIGTLADEIETMLESIDGHSIIVDIGFKLDRLRELLKEMQS